jgi:hypothetical protein
MASTPEGKVKDAVKAALESLGVRSLSRPTRVTCLDIGTYYMPVSNGMGTHGIPDFVCSVRGKSLYIETKASVKKEPTDLQMAVIDALRSTGSVAIVIRSVDEARERLPVVVERLLNGDS